MRNLLLRLADLCARFRVGPLRRVECGSVALLVPEVE